MGAVGEEIEVHAERNVSGVGKALPGRDDLGLVEASAVKFSELFQAATVEYDQTSADAAFAAIRTLPELKGPGLSQGDAIQVVTQLSILRNQVVDVGRFALYTKTGALGGIETPKTRKQADKIDAWVRAGGSVRPIVGGEDLNTPAPPGPGLPAQWGSDLALALDECMFRISEAERGPNIPIGFSEIRGSLALGLPIVAVIVVGVAVATISSVAAWRYLDPDTRLAITQVRDAGRNYRDRVKVYQDTGQMPPPSPSEVASESIVADLSSSRKKHDWIWGAALGGGVTAFVLSAAYIGSAR